MAPQAGASGSVSGINGTLAPLGDFSSRRQLASVRLSVCLSVLVTETLLCAALWWAVFGAAPTPPLSKHGPVDHKSISDAALGGEAAHREPRRLLFIFHVRNYVPSAKF